MPPRTQRGGGGSGASTKPQQRQQQQPPQQQQQQPPQQQQQQQQPPQQQQPQQPQQLHNFHQHSPPQPQHGGGAMGYNSSGYGAGNVGGGYNNNNMQQQQQPPSGHHHHHHHHQQQQQQQQQPPPHGWAGGSNNTPNAAGGGGYSGSMNNSMYSGAPPPPPPPPPSSHHSAGNSGPPPPPPPQQQHYGPEGSGEYGQNGSMHGSPYPQPQQQQPQQPQQQQQPLPPQQQQQRRMHGQSYYNNNNNNGGQQQQQQQQQQPHPPPPPPSQQQQQQGSGYRGGGHGQRMDSSPSYGSGAAMPPPPQQQQQQQQRNNSNSMYAPEDNNSPPPPSPGYRGGGSNNNTPNANYGYAQSPPQQQQQQQPPPPMQGSYGAMGGHPMQQQQPPPPHPQGMYGAPNGMPPMGPPPPQQQQQQPWMGMPPHGGYAAGPPPPPMPMGGPQGMEQVPPPPPPQQQQQQMPMGPPRGRGGRGGGRGDRGSPGQQQQQQQQQHPQQGSYRGRGQGYQGRPTGVPVGPMPPQQPPMVDQVPLMPNQGGQMMYPPDMELATYPVDAVGMEEPSPEDEIPPIPQTFFYDFLKDRRLLKSADLGEFVQQRCGGARDKPIRVAIDGNYMTISLRARMEEVDPLWFLHSALPDLLVEMINTQVSRMREKNLEPIWIFQGLVASGDVEAFLPSRDELLGRDRVWQQLADGSVPSRDRISEAFEVCSTVNGDVAMAIQRFLQSELNVTCLTAPFLNWAQMATFHHDGEAELLVGPPDMLILPYRPMDAIVEIDVERGQVAYFNRDEVLQELFPHYATEEDGMRAAGDRLLDFGLFVSGHPVLSSLRAQLKLTGDEIYDELAARDPRYPSLIAFIDGNEPRDKNLPPESRSGAQRLRHYKGRSYVTCSPVFTGSIPDSPLAYFIRVLDPTLKDHNMSKNFSGIFGNYLPLAFYYFMYSGLLSADFLTILCLAYFRDETPISDSVELRNFVPMLVALRSQTLVQAVNRLERKLGDRVTVISWVRWFDPVLVSVQRPNDSITLDEWDLHNSAEAQQLLLDMDSEDISIDRLLQLHPNVDCIAAPLSEPGVGPAEPLYHGHNETYLAVMLKLFDFLGYFSHPTPTQGVEAEGGQDLAGGVADGMENYDAGHGQQIQNNNGNNIDGCVPMENGGDVDGDLEEDEEEAEGDLASISTAALIATLQACPQEFHEAMVRLTEMTRVRALNANPYNYYLVKDSSDELLTEEDREDSPEILLASRIACLITVPYGGSSPDEKNGEDSFEWAPVYCRHICTFTVIVRAMNRCLRELVEVIATTTFLPGYSSSSLDEVASLVPRLPFAQIPSSIGGLLLHYVLVFPSDYERNCETPKQRCDHLQSLFRHIPDVTVQLRRVMTFVFHALYFLTAYRTCLQQDNGIDESLLVHGTAEGEIDIIAETIFLLATKWREHLDDDIPQDPHGFCSPDNIA